MISTFCRRGVINFSAILRKTTKSRSHILSYKTSVSLFHSQPGHYSKSNVTPIHISSPRCTAVVCSFHSSTCLRRNVIPFLLSDIGEGIVEVVVKEWFVKTGEKVAQFDPVCEVQSDKASVTISSRYDGVIRKLHHEIDGIALVGKPLLDIEVEKEATSEESSVMPDDILQEMGEKVVNKMPPVVDDSAFYENKALATPSVRRIAKENNVNLSKVIGTGKGGRILKEDILVHVDGINRGMPEIGQNVTSTSASGDIVEAIIGFRRAMAKSMANAWRIPHFSYCDEVNVIELVEAKTHIKRIGQSAGTNITYMPFFIKAASQALLKYPILNSLVDEKCEYLTIKKWHNVGVAIDTPNGLVVPNIKNVQNLSIVEIARELNRLQQKGANGQLAMEDLSNGSFTLSNIGAIGGTYAKPIIFSPQVAIGALGQIQVLPRFDKNGNVQAAHILNISWSADHRVVDGATIAKFSNLWKIYVENPRLLLSL